MTLKTFSLLAEGVLSELGAQCPPAGFEAQAWAVRLCRLHEGLSAVMSGLADWFWPDAPLTPLFAVVVLVGIAVGLARGLERLARAREAVWLEITPPAQPASDGGLGLWRALAGALRHGGTRRARTRSRLVGWWAAAPVLAAEWWADARGVRAGVWVPGSLDAEHVADAITRAVPGALVRHRTPPQWHRLPSRALELAPGGGTWAPLIDPTTRPTQAGERADEEALRAVLAALAHRRRGEQACLQLVVSPPARSSRTHHTGAGAGMGAAWLRAAAPALIGGLLGALAAGLLFVLDVLAPGRSRAGGGRRTATGRGPTGGPTGRVAARWEAKRAAGPHLPVTVRIAVATATPARWRDDATRAVDIAAGYDLITPAALRGRWRRWRAADPVVLRTHGRAFMATLPELAALWHLPTHPARYRITAPTALNHAPPPALCIRDPHPTSPRDGQRRPSQSGEERPTDEGPESGSAVRAIRGRAAGDPPGHPSAPDPRPATPHRAGAGVRAHAGDRRAATPARTRARSG